jgi:hypothetical protein
MSSTRNAESLEAGTEFSPRAPRAESLTQKGHAPGVMVGIDAVPEYHVKAFEPGTAPEEDSFKPQPSSETPGQGQNPNSETSTSADSTLHGSTSADVHTGIGKPLQGQEGREIVGEHDRKRKGERSGLEGIAGGVGDDSVREKGADLPEGVQKGVKTGEYEGAEEKVPESAESIAAEFGR